MRKTVRNDNSSRSSASLSDLRFDGGGGRRGAHLPAPRHQRRGRGTRFGLLSSPSAAAVRAPSLPADAQRISSPRRRRRVLHPRRRRRSGVDEARSYAARFALVHRLSDASQLGTCGRRRATRRRRRLRTRTARRSVQRGCYADRVAIGGTAPEHGGSASSKAADATMVVVNGVRAACAARVLGRVATEAALSPPDELGDGMPHYEHRGCSTSSTSSTSTRATEGCRGGCSGRYPANGSFVDERRAHL